MTRSTLTRSVACAIACAGLSIFTRGAAAQIMSAPATPNATSGTALTDWNISYRMPVNWRVGQTIGRLQMIVSNTDAGMIFLAPGMYATPQDAIADLSTFYQQMQMQAYPVEQPAMGPMETVVFDGQGSYRWSSASQVSVTTPGISAGAGSANGSTTGGDQGSYTVIGNTLVLKGTKGQLAVDFQLGNGQLIAAGKRYVRQ
jgi:hypothetical protein